MLAECLNLFMFRNWINSTESRMQEKLKLRLFSTLINFWERRIFLLFFFNNFMLTLKIKPRQQRQYIYIVVSVGLILTHLKVERLFFQSVNIPLYFEYLEVIKYCMTAWINDVYNEDIKMQRWQRSIFISMLQVFYKGSFNLTQHCMHKKDMYDCISNSCTLI